VEGMLSVQLHSKKEDFKCIVELLTTHLAALLLYKVLISLVLRVSDRHRCSHLGCSRLVGQFKHLRSESIAEGPFHLGEAILLFKLILLHVLFIDLSMVAHDIG
jgi:hypothetical protein